MSGSNLETRSFLDELRSLDKNFYFDLGHPLLNRMADCFVRAAGIGAVQAVTREAYFIALESYNVDSDVGANNKHHRFPGLRGEDSGKSVEALVMRTGRESLQWGTAAGVYSGLTYGLKEARGVHDWKNSVLAGAITGATIALTTGDKTHETVMEFAITGAALSAAANLLTGIF